MAENLHAWAQGAFHPAKLSGTPLPVLRRSALVQRSSGVSGASSVLGLGTAALVGLGALGGGILIGLLIGRWWKRRREEQAQATLARVA